MDLQESGTAHRSRGSMLFFVEEWLRVILVAAMVPPNLKPPARGRVTAAQSQGCLSKVSTKPRASCHAIQLITLFQPACAIS